jgi:CheY-like chemotaxis protein
VKIAVTDTGVGMDERTMERIFEPFFTTKEMGRGTGLGLASVYGIVKGHKGFINVYSQLGHGTTFNVYIPATGKKQEKESDVVDEIMGGRETLLLVDDEEMIRKVGKEVIEALGYKAILASGGLEAIEIYRARKQEIDVIILDMIMPDLDGGRTFDTLVGMNPAIKVILSSGYSLNHEAESIMQRGCKAFIQKPFNAYDLSRVVRAVIEGHHPSDSSNYGGEKKNS